MMQGRLAELASAGFFIYCVALAFRQARGNPEIVDGSAVPLDPRRRRRVLLGSAAGLIAVAVWRASGAGIAREWILPPIVLLLAYWTSGLLFTSPSAAAEERLLTIDHAIGVRTMAARAPRLVAELLELAYVGVYPLIPVALALHLAFTPGPDPDRFWAVMLITDYICFGMLPWVQTRPPRALEPREPWRSSIRRANLRLVGGASIGANTFPSGHAAEAFAAALLVIDAPAAVAGAMFVSAAAISAGAVLGRYHYAADALAGWMVALAVWGLL